MRFNTAISQLMVFVNEAYKAEALPVQYMNGFIQLLAPIAPHIAQELWSKLDNSDDLSYAAWPKYDASQLVEDTAEIVFQVNGKVRGRMTVPLDADREQLIALAEADENVQKSIEGLSVRKIIAIPGKIVNIVAN